MDSRYFSSPDLLALLAGLAVALVLGLLVGTALLRLSLRWIAHVRVGFLRGLGTLLVGATLGAVANYALMSVLTLAMLASGAALHTGPGLGLSVVASLAGFLLSAVALAFAVQWLVVRTDGSRVPFARALAVAAAALAMGAALHAAVVGALLLGLGGVPGVSR